VCVAEAEETTELEQIATALCSIFDTLWMAVQNVLSWSLCSVNRTVPAGERDVALKATSTGGD
jgi:hypothetical protein